MLNKTSISPEQQKFRWVISKSQDTLADIFYAFNSRRAVGNTIPLQKWKVSRWERSIRVGSHYITVDLMIEFLHQNKEKKPPKKLPQRSRDEETQPLFQLHRC